jgi:hypothetical protein
MRALAQGRDEPGETHPDSGARPNPRVAFTDNKRPLAKFYDFSNRTRQPGS